LKAILENKAITPAAVSAWRAPLPSPLGGPLIPWSPLAYAAWAVIASAGERWHALAEYEPVFHEPQIFDDGAPGAPPGMTEKGLLGLACMVRPDMLMDQAHRPGRGIVFHQQRPFQADWVPNPLWAAVPATAQALLTSSRTAPKRRALLHHALMAGVNRLVARERPLFLDAYLDVLVPRSGPPPPPEVQAWVSAVPDLHSLLHRRQIVQAAQHRPLARGPRPLRPRS
jgi:hypothetical protein